ncbi:uncharacterized protein LOC128951571 [Oppia nitens]|uniref:uncharacterized protein LOC128951571 n=1 Tax=Oppia nitens TaxID=1686743 RepID=UPI0023D9FC80|nr:uncharacterized protein LOC128951571 [Oppia nitens]
MASQNCETNELDESSSGQQLKNLPPDKLMECEAKSESAIYKQTWIFRYHFEQCDDIVEAAFRVADYVPERRKQLTANGDVNEENIWKDTIIPILVENLKQDVEFRGVVMESFAAIRSLTITIQKAYNIVNECKGSVVSIKIAQKNIPNALKRLDECFNKAKNLDDSAIKKFGDEINTILNIIGPEAATFMEEIVKLQAEINKCYEEKNKLMEPVAELEGL